MCEYRTINCIQLNIRDIVLIVLGIFAPDMLIKPDTVTAADSASLT